MLDALLFWLEELLHTYDDVYVVSMSQVLAWMQRPTTAARAVNFAPWKTKCTSLDTPDSCQVSASSLHIYLIPHEIWLCFTGIQRL